MKTKVFASLLLFAFVALLAGCPQRTTISQLNGNSGRYRDKEVLVIGEVTNSFGALGRGAFELSDETGKIWVITERGVPARGERVGSIGRFMGGVTWEGRNFGSALRETDRKRRF